MTTALGDCHVCGAEQVATHFLATCDRCRAAAGRFSYQAPTGGKTRSRRGPQVVSYTETFCCSFCGRTPKEVRKIFSGPWVFICDGCVALASDAMREDQGESWPSQPSGGGRSQAAGKTHPGRLGLVDADTREITGVDRTRTPPSTSTPRRTPRTTKR